jgi:type II secretory pathway component PulJ
MSQRQIVVQVGRQRAREGHREEERQSERVWQKRSGRDTYHRTDWQYHLVTEECSQSLRGNLRVHIKHEVACVVRSLC